MVVVEEEKELQEEEEPSRRQRETPPPSDPPPPFKGGEDWLGPWLGPLPPLLLDRCCAQFVVHRDLIRHRPRRFYEEALRTIHAHVKDDDSTRGKSSRSWGLLMEWVWHYAFGGSAVAVHDPAVRKVTQLGGLERFDRLVVGRAPCVA